MVIAVSFADAAVRRIPLYKKLNNTINNALVSREDYVVSGWLPNWFIGGEAYAPSLGTKLKQQIRAVAC
jgi:hypothetical protein